MTTLNLNLHRQLRTSRRLLCVRTFIDHALVLSMFMLSFIDHALSMFMFSFFCVILCGLFDWERIYSFFYRLFMYCCWRDNYQEGGGEIPLTNITTPRFYRFPRPLPVFQTLPRFYRFLISTRISNVATCLSLSQTSTRISNVATCLSLSHTNTRISNVSSRGLFMFNNLR